MASTLTPAGADGGADGVAGAAGVHDGAAVIVRPLDPGEIDALTALDKEHAAKHGVRTVVSRASVHYFLRSGHSFVAELRSSEAGSDSGTAGVILAHAVWAGSGAVVRVERLALAESGGRQPQVASALTAAVVKSAYDAGVYRLLATLPLSDDVSIGALAAARFEREASAVFELSLGSGVLSGTGAGEVSEPADDDSRRSA